MSARHLGTERRIASPFSQRLDEVIAAQTHLSPEFLPRAVVSIPALRHEFSEASTGVVAPTAELGKRPIDVQPVRRVPKARSLGVAAPSMVRRRPNHTGAHWVEDDVAHQFQQVPLPLDQNASVASLKQVTDPVVAAVERLRVDAVELTHPACEVGVRGFDQEMVVVGHQDPGVKPPTHCSDDTCQCLDKTSSIGVVDRDVLPGVATTRDVPDRA